MFAVELVFHGDLISFLRHEFRSHGIIRRQISEKTAVKDVIEACGVPHPEIDLIVISGSNGSVGANAVDFLWPVEAPVRVEVYPVPAPATVRPEKQRLQARHFSRFVADGHLGKLARNLRLLGIDTAYERDADDRRLLEIMATEDRALLTRDRRLLMHTIVRHGYYPRSQDPEAQTHEVLNRFSLRGNAAEVAPYSRCLRCNGPLVPVPKEEVLAPLANEPLTLRYYDAFRRCSVCQQIFWPGTHFEKLAAIVAKLLGNH